MKHTPKTYAQALIAAAENRNPKDIAEKFWHELQKNGQYKDLNKIVDAIDEEFARQNDQILAKVYVSEELTEDEVNNISARIAHKYSSNNKILIKQVIKKNITGIIVKINDVEVDLSLENKINKLRQSFNSEMDNGQNEPRTIERA